MKKPVWMLVLALSASLTMLPASAPAQAATVTVVSTCPSAGSCEVSTQTLKGILTKCKNVDTKTTKQILKKCTGGNCNTVDTADLKKILKKCGKIDNSTITQIVKQCKKSCNTQQCQSSPATPVPENQTATGNDASPASESTTPGNESAAATSDAYIQRVVDLVNRERAKAGLNPVVLQENLTAAAQVRAKEIVTSFSHTRPNGTSCFTALKEAGVSYMGAGENIAYGQLSADAVMEGWMNSSGHRANILNKNFTKIGIGHYQNASGVHYWTQFFTY